ncbi:hypothetical protein CASFOL_016458 [Castilleja foliolosa]|uniref:BHLH domain-containing protein n=1 Tax=Castilleja foliolosa TaxID=1961234 RepID=A0ABD3DGN3_9LAMI
MKMDEISLAEMFDYPEIIYSDISQPILLSNYDIDEQIIMNTSINNVWDSNQKNNKTSDDHMIIINPNLSSSSSSSKPVVGPAQLISFESSNTILDIVSPNSAKFTSMNFSSSSSPVNNDDYAANDERLISQNKKVMTCTSTMTGRTTFQARDHVLAERRRRQNLGQLFISLSKVVPGLKKLDKASLLEDAIKHLKALQERVSVLEKEKSISTDEYDDHHYTSDDHHKEIISKLISSTADEIKVRISGKHVLIKINCKKQNGLMSRVPRQLEEIHLSVVDIRIMPFGGETHLVITVLAEMKSEFRGTVKNIVEQLQTIFSNTA